MSDPATAGQNGCSPIDASRRRRKGLHPLEAAEHRPQSLRSVAWMPDELNWRIGLVFAVGASSFALGALLTLWPTLARALAVDASEINAIYFAGSIPFTTAAYLQLFQAANAPNHPVDELRRPGRRPALVGWRPRDIGWLSCALQFLGTLAFNFSTFDAMLPGLDWLQQDWAIWAPDMMGSVLFLTSGYLAFVEACQSYWAWHPHRLSWRITFANLLGCVAFMISALSAFVPAGGPSTDMATVSVLATFLGALGFLLGALLMLQEAAVHQRAALERGLGRD